MIIKTEEQAVKALGDAGKGVWAGDIQRLNFLGVDYDFERPVAESLTIEEVIQLFEEYGLRHAIYTDRAREKARAEALEGWQPIETAPKDGTRVLVFTDDEVVADWFGAQWGFARGTTHWRPLPTPPVL